MKTMQEIQSKIKALETQLDFVLRQRDECKSTHTYFLKFKEAHRISEEINLLSWVIED